MLSDAVVKDALLMDALFTSIASPTHGVPQASSKPHVNVRAPIVEQQVKI